MEKPNEYVCYDVCLGVDVNDYYPFGKRIAPPPVAEPVEATSQSATSPNRWLFSGKARKMSVSYNGIVINRDYQYGRHH